MVMMHLPSLSVPDVSSNLDPGAKEMLRMVELTEFMLSGCVGESSLDRDSTESLHEIHRRLNRKAR